MYDNTNRGQIWPNDEKLTDKHPDFQGSLDVEGVEYWVSAWKRKPGENPKAPSLKFTIKKKEKRKENKKEDNDEFKDDDIPF